MPCSARTDDVRGGGGALRFLVDGGRWSPGWDRDILWRPWVMWSKGSGEGGGLGVVCLTAVSFTLILLKESITARVGVHVPVFFL